MSESKLEKMMSGNSISEIEVAAKYKPLKRSLCERNVSLIKTKGLVL